MDDGPRASDAERDQVVAALQRHFTDGRLTAEELDERVERTFKARALRELYELMADLPDLPVVDVPHPPVHNARPRRRWRRG